MVHLLVTGLGEMLIMKINEITELVKKSNLKKYFIARFCSVSTRAESNRTGE